MRRQRESMRRLFLSRPNQRIPVYEVADIALQYGRCVKELRAEGMRIENHYEGTFNGTKHTSFEYIPPGELFGAAGYSKERRG